MAMPERIWAYEVEGCDGTQVWQRKTVAGTTEYIRADLVDELVKALEVVAKMRRKVTTEYAGRTYEECSACGCTLSEDELHDGDCEWPIIDAALTRIKGNGK